jgi:hypothetical protein
MCRQAQGADSCPLSVLFLSERFSGLNEVANERFLKVLFTLDQFLVISAEMLTFVKTFSVPIGELQVAAFSLRRPDLLLILFFLTSSCNVGVNRASKN